MHPASILSYYPTYSILDEIISYNEYDTLYLYIDLKNCLQSIYMEHTIVNLIENTKLTNVHDSSVFISLLSFLSFHKIYASKRNVKIKFFIFYESGRSYYHQNICKKYKVSRRIDDLYGLDSVDRELFADIMRSNFILIERGCGGMPNVKILRLLNMEADFIPYYLTTRNRVENTPNIAHVVYSNDHDLVQFVGDHRYVFRKVPRKKEIVKKKGGMKIQLHCDCDLDDELQSLAIAVIGDPGDDVDGIKGIGPKTFLKIVPELNKMTGGMNQLYDNVLKGEKIFNPTGIIKNKHINKLLKKEEQDGLISKNMKLVSFELMSRYFDDPDTTEMLERRNKLLYTLENNEVIPKERIEEVLERYRIDFQGEELDNIYFGYDGG